MKNMFKYYLSNKRRGISLIFVMALTVFSIYFVTSLVQSIFSTVEYSNIACLNDFSFVYPVGGSSFLQNETVEKIKNDDSVENAYPILLEYTEQRAVMSHLWKKRISEKYLMIFR